MKKAKMIERERAINRISYSEATKAVNHRISLQNPTQSQVMRETQVINIDTQPTQAYTARENVVNEVNLSQ